VLQEGAVGGDGRGDRPRRFIAAEKGKKVVSKKHKITKAEVARAVAAVP
jgi:hypothetical protein